MKYPYKYQFRRVALVIVIVAVSVVASGFIRAQAATLPVRVPANVEWVSTGIEVKTGDTFNIKSEGVAITAPVNQYGQGPISGPAGQTWNLGCGQYTGAPPPCALNDAPYGMLIGKVSGYVFAIGDGESFIAPADGLLYFSVNDNDNGYTDNLGGYTVLFK